MVIKHHPGPMGTRQVTMHRAQSDRRWQFALFRTCPTSSRIGLIDAGPVRERLDTVSDDMPYSIAILCDVLKRRRLCLNVIWRSCQTVVTLGLTALGRSKMVPVTLQRCFSLIIVRLLQLICIVTQVTLTPVASHRRESMLLFSGCLCISKVYMKSCNDKPAFNIPMTCEHCITMSGWKLRYLLGHIWRDMHVRYTPVGMFLLATSIDYTKQKCVVSFGIQYRLYKTKVCSFFWHPV